MAEGGESSGVIVTDEGLLTFTLEPSARRAFYVKKAAPSAPLAQQAPLAPPAPSAPLTPPAPHSVATFVTPAPESAPSHHSQSLLSSERVESVVPNVAPAPAPSHYTPSLFSNETVDSDAPSVATERSATSNSSKRFAVYTLKENTTIKTLLMPYVRIQLNAHRTPRGNEVMAELNKSIQGQKFINTKTEKQLYDKCKSIYNNERNKLKNSKYE